MKEYKIMVKSVESGEWFRASRFGLRGKVYTSKAEAVELAERYMEADRKTAPALFNEYKIMAREVGEWEDC